MARKRLTHKNASPPPQMPAVDRTEGPASPAYYPDPDADKYENGNPSSWAEDPHNPMDPESAPAAMPGNLTTEGLSHPATTDFQRGADKPSEGAAKQASLRELAERRAAICVRIASAMLPGASTLDIEKKAVQLMDVEDENQLIATARTLNVLASDDDEDAGDDEDEDMGKEASHNLTARLDRLEGSVGRLVQAMGEFFGMEDDGDGDGSNMDDKELMAVLMAEDMDGDGIDQSKNDYPQDYDVEKMSGEDEAEAEVMEMDVEEKMGGDDKEEEQMLAAMLAEMGDMDENPEGMHMASAAEEATEGLATGESVQSGEGGTTNPDEYADTPLVAQSDGKIEDGDPTPHGKSSADVDPMGLTEIATKSASADDELMALYADLDLPKVAGEEMEEEEEEEIEMKMAGEEMEEEEEEEVEMKMASPRPQNKKASTGAKTLGNVAGMPKQAADEIAELGKLWESAPDVGGVFGMPSGN